ncbi:MAG: site-2 protease family protein [Anaerolineae bacterium]
MEKLRSINLGRFSQDKVFWIFVLLVIVAFALVQTDSMLRTVFTLVALLTAITVHECSHAWMANRLGDRTAALLGRITLNPLAHLDPLGSVMMLITTLTGLGIGWGKPVPVATYRLRYGPRVGNGIVSLAGPASNIVAAVLFAMAGRLIGPWAGNAEFVLQLLDYVVLINIVIAFFNLLPFPPLDGFGVLVALLALIKQEWARSAVATLEGLYRYGWMILFGVILLSQFTGLSLLDRVVGQPAFALFYVLTGL